MVPKGMYLDKSVEAGKRELLLETDYTREAASQMKFKQLLADEPDYIIPAVIANLSTKRVLTSELVSGIPVDQLGSLDQETRNWVASKMLRLCLRELFEFRFMQTDPNWSNFFYDTKTKKVQNRKK
jgi:aarF domain-containing kinase